ncbi:MAG: hypothetical protein AM1032_000092 [Mycoplasmataceae bacterium]|nr:MAG: hypothetical protein AM1032_000092 [Mycoplasmataceae bacterium]
MEYHKKEVIIKVSETSGLLWPYHQDKKALSSSTLTTILKEIEYGDKQIPKFVLMKAANNGKIFHETIQNFLVNGDEESYLSLKISPKTLEKIKESLIFFKEKDFKNFLGIEKLHYCFYEENFFGSYVDLEFDDFIIELKTNNVIIDQSPISVLIFKIQLLIQHLCTKKDIYLLWSTGQGVFFNKFDKSEELLEILKILVNIVDNKDIYSFEVKREIIKRLLEVYSKGTSNKRFLS